jgi:hypothetical protein
MPSIAFALRGLSPLKTLPAFGEPRGFCLNSPISANKKPHHLSIMGFSLMVEAGGIHGVRPCTPPYGQLLLCKIAPGNFVNPDYASSILTFAKH